MMSKKFIVEPCVCGFKELEESMNSFFDRGYYPIDINLSEYAGRAEGFIIYELRGGQGR